MLKGVVKVGAVNVDKETKLGDDYKIEGFPTIKVFGFNKKEPVEYEGARHADGIVKFAANQVKDNI